MTRIYARLLVHRRWICNLALAIALLTSSPISIQSQTLNAPAQTLPASVATLETTDLEGFTTHSPELQQRLTAALALTKLNLTYLYNSHDPKRGGMDCSGTIYHLFQSLGHKDIPRQSNEMAEWVIKSGIWTQTPAPRKLTDPLFSQLKPGDLLFWSDTDAPKERKLPISHVMLYLGRHCTTGKPIVFGASDGRSYAGQRRCGVSVFDFALPRATGKIAFYGYGTPPPKPIKK